MRATKQPWTLSKITASFLSWLGLDRTENKEAQCLQKPDTGSWSTPLTPDNHRQAIALSPPSNSSIAGNPSVKYGVQSGKALET